jgi:hypothetical protein
MAEQWYYTENGQQQGPVSEEQLKELASSGRLKPSEMVWKQGMAQWTKVGQVPGLLATVGPSQPPPIPQQGLFAQECLFLSGLPRVARIAGRPMLAAGLVLALLARGCDLLAKRSADSATAQARVAQAQFDDPWIKQVSETQSRIAALEEKENPTPADTKEIQDARASLRDLEKAKQKALRSFQNGTLRDVTVAARDAESAYLIGAYWREMFFVFGAVVLALGLLMVSWVAEGAERWVSLMMLAIITVSLFLGSAVWVSK